MKSNTLNINHKNGVTYLTFPKFEKSGIVNHLFSTRIGGVRPGRSKNITKLFQRRQA